MSSTILSPESDINASRVRLVITVPSVMISITTITVILRFTVKWKRNLSLGGDDWLILGASILAVVPVGLFIASASKQELGRHIGFNGPDAQTAFLKKLYFGGLVATLAIGITRLSIFVSYRRMFSSSSQTMEVILLIIAGIVTCGGIGFFIASVLQCNPIHKAWDTAVEGTCINTHVLFLSNATFNVITNFSLLVLPQPTIWKMQVGMRTKVVLSCFIPLGGWIIVISGVRFRSPLYLNIASTDVTWKMVVPVIWLCVEMQGSILCACLPFVRKLFTATTAHTRFSTGGSKSAPGHESLEKLEGRGQNTPTARACAESGQSVGEEKFSREFDQEK